MATRTITTKLAIEGEKEYKAQIQSINAQYQVYKSELASVEAQYRTNANSLEALTAKESALSGQQDLLSKRHQAQAEMLNKAKTAQGEYAKQVEELKNRLAELKESSGSSAEEQKTLNEELEKAEERLQMATNSVQEYQKGLNYTARDQANLSAKLEETRKYLDEAKNNADKCASSFDEFGNRTSEGGNAVSLLASALAAADTAHFADGLAAAAINSNTSVSVMGETFQNSAAIAGTLDYSIDEADVSVGLMANAGNQGQQCRHRVEKCLQWPFGGCDADRRGAGRI